MQPPITARWPWSSPSLAARSDGRSVTTRAAIRMSGAGLVFAVLLAWSGTFSSPFLFDDLEAIVDNPSIRRLWPISQALSPPADSGGVIGRPLVNISFALNHAISGDAVWSYHVVNLVIHGASTLLLFGVVRRTLLVPTLARRFGESSLGLAWLITALWTLHPLQTESVTCVVQRTESLMGMFYLLTLYAFVRGTELTRSRRWLLGSVGACVLGMAAKEVMVTAPIIVLLYDRTFVAGTFGKALRARAAYYCALASTWLLLGALVFSTGGARGTGAGFGLGVTPWTYALTQCRAIVLYLRLAVWPDPLVLDYGTEVVGQIGEIWAQALLLAALLAGTAVALWRRQRLGFFGAWFFIILAPSSSVMPLVGQTIAEHRMYLPLAALSAGAVVLAWNAWGRPVLIAGSLVAGLLGVVTAARNEDYRNPITLWRDTVAKMPGNGRAHGNLAMYLAEQPERQAEALAQFETAARLMPGYADAHFNLANFLAGQPGRQADALQHYEKAVRLNPAHVEARIGLANQLASERERQGEAVEHYEQVLRIMPGYAEVHNNLAALLARQTGHEADALAHYETALRLKPEYAEAHCNFGLLLVRMRGRRAEALAQFETALRIRPDFSDARRHLAHFSSVDLGE